MSQKVKKINRILDYTATWANDVLTVTTNATHYLKNGDKVDFLFANSGQEYPGASITVTDVNEFTIALTDSTKIQSKGKISIPYFSTGQTGVVATFGISKTIAIPSVIQFTAHGAGGAVMVLAVSNDGYGWVDIATVTLNSADHATEFVPIAPNWTMARLSATSIGASTSVVVTSTV